MLTQHWIQNVLLLVRTILPIHQTAAHSPIISPITSDSDSVTSTESHMESSLSDVSSLDVFTSDSSAT